LVIFNKSDLFNLKIVNFKSAITEMYPRIPLELVANPMGSAEHTSGTTALECSYAWLLNHVTDDDHY